MEDINVVRKDIVEEYWLEFLKHIKANQVKQQELIKERARLAAKRVIDGNYESERLGVVGGYANTVSKEVDCDYYQVDIYSFWNWYIKYKV